MHKNTLFGLIRNLLHVLSENLQLKKCKDRTKKHPSGNPCQINNTQGWYQNLQSAGSILKPRYKKEVDRY